MQHTRKEQMEAFGRFLDILDELRVKCPWTRSRPTHRPDRLRHDHHHGLPRALTARHSHKLSDSGESDIQNAKPIP